MRTCHCTGHLRNPGGKCCMDLPGNVQPRSDGLGMGFATHPATIDLRCPCGATGRVSANSVAAANALAKAFYEAHAAHHAAPASEGEQA